MPKNHTDPTGRRRLPFKFWMLLFLASALAVWLLHAPVLSWGARKAMEAWCSANLLTFSADKVAVRLDGPVVLEGVRFRSAPGSGHLTSLDIGRIGWQWGGIGSLFSENGRCLRELSVQGVAGTWDFSRGQKFRGALIAPGGLVRWIPQKISLEIHSLDLLAMTRKLSVRDLSANCSEFESGQLSLGGLALRTGLFSRAFGPIRGKTAWKYGTLWLAAMEVLPGILVENLSADFLHPGGAALSLTANCFGGSLRGDAGLSAADGTFDIAAWVSNVPMDKIAALMGGAGEVSGKLAEGRFTFRGKPERPADAEASLRLVAEGFQWNKRGWESLEVGASLIHRRLVVSGFELRQKENQVVFSGEISLADGWSEIARSPFLLNIKADIRELGALAGLLGGPLSEAGGRMTATGSVAGRAGRVDGFLSVEASDIRIRSLPPSILRAEAVFREGGVEIARCDLFSKKDTVSLQGTVSQASPYQYAVEVNARLADLATYLAPFQPPGKGQIYAGAMEAWWQGDGTAQSHSGAFDVKLKDFVSGTTPAGLTGEFTGTYSPQNLYFSKFRIAKGPLRLDSRATFASSGITLKDVELRAGNSPLLEGSAFVPVNLFAILHGKDWRASIDPEREAYLRAVAPKDLSLRALLELVGQDLPLDGQLRFTLEAGGLPAQLTTKGSLSARDLVWKQSSVPPSRLNLNFDAAGGKASLGGGLETKGFPSLQLSAQMPFGLVRTEAGDWRWLNPSGTFDASLDFPRADLAVFRPFLPSLHQLTGSISGKLAFSGTMGEPKTSGWIEIENAGMSLSDQTPPVAKTNATLSFDGSRLQVQKFRGEIGTGPYEISGSIGVADPSNPSWDLQLHGKNILLARDAGLRLFANVDLTAVGNHESGKVSGSARLVNGRIFRRLEISPTLLLKPQDSKGIVFETPQVPAPFSRWALDVKVTNETPFLISGPIGEGEILPDVTLAGTVSQPVPVGRVTLKNVTAFLPAGTMRIPEGRLDFFPDAPWVPMLDVRGSVQTPLQEVKTYAFGPLNQNKLILRSDPPLPQELLVRLISTVPARPGFADPAAGSLPLPPDSLNLFLDPAQIQTFVPRATDEAAALTGRLLLTNGFDLGPERDGYGFFHAGVTYTWRFY